MFAKLQTQRDIPTTACYIRISVQECRRV